MCIRDRPQRDGRAVVAGALAPVGADRRELQGEADLAAVPHVEIWNRSGYTALYSTGKCFGAFYYASAVWATQKVFASPELVTTRASYISQNPRVAGPERGHEMTRARMQSRGLDR